MNESDKFFKIVSEFGNVIHIQPQGIWTDEVAEKWGDELKTKFRMAVDAMHGKGRKFIVLANMSNFHIRGQKTRELLTELMKISVGNELFYRTVQIIPDEATRREIKLSSIKANQTNVKIVVADKDEANKEILELKKGMIFL